MAPVGRVSWSEALPAVETRVPETGLIGKSIGPEAEAKVKAMGLEAGTNVRDWGPFVMPPCNWAGKWSGCCLWNIW